MHTGFERVGAFSESQGQYDWVSQLIGAFNPAHRMVFENVFTEKYRQP